MFQAEAELSVKSHHTMNPNDTLDLLTKSPLNSLWRRTDDGRIYTLTRRIFDNLTFTCNGQSVLCTSFSAAQHFTPYTPKNAHVETFIDGIYITYQYHPRQPRTGSTPPVSSYVDLVSAEVGAVNPIDIYKFLDNQGLLEHFEVNLCEHHEHTHNITTP